MTVTRRLCVFGLSLSDVASRLSDRLTADNPRLSLTADENEVTVLVSADADSPETAAASLDEATAFVRDCLGIFVYGEDTPDLQHRVVSLLLEKNKKIATAESCTAGLLSGALTEVGGASAVFDCGIVSYSNDIKHSVLGVPQKLLDTHGAVSEEVAAAMATGVRRLSGADFGIGITGVAGPGPSEGIPAGTVFVSLADEKRVWVKKIEYPDASREQVRLFAVKTALDLARRYLEAFPGVMAGAFSLEKPSSETIPFPTGRVKKLHFWSPLFPSKSQGKAAAFRAAALWLLIVVTLAVVAFSLYYFIYRPLHNEQIYDRLETVYYAGLAETSVVVDTSSYPDGMLSRFYALYDQNPDIRGWLKIDGTTISYPVMDSRHSDYYATHDFEGASSAYGVPYFDSAADFSSAKAAESARTLTIYGGIREGDAQMLSPLWRYTDKTFFAAHEYLTLNTLYAEHRYRVAAVFTADNTDTATDFPYDDPPADKDGYTAFLKELESRSLYTLPFPLTADSHLLFLSVEAPNEGHPARRLVVAAERLASGASERTYKIEDNPTASLPVVSGDEASDPAVSSVSAVPVTTTKQTAHPTTARQNNTPAAVTTTRKPTTTVPTTTRKPTVPPTTASTTASTTEPTIFTTEPTVFTTAPENPE